jgi:hypothetical protein
VTRSLTPSEKVEHQALYPQLDVNAALVFAENDTVYNCISWTVGVTTAWYWPGSTIEEFDDFYESFGYVRRTTGPIAVWGYGFLDLQHGSVSGAGHGPRWESKCGGLLGIQHDQDELTSNSYGQIVAYYRVDWFRNVLLWISTNLWRKKWWIMVPDHSNILDEAVARMDPAILGRFEQLFGEWKLGWSSQAVLSHSNPAAVRRLPQFEALVELGPQALPALARKLADPANFFALQLYDALAERKLVHVERPVPDRRSGEQGRAMAVAAALAQSLSRRPRTSRPGA